jgi:hypothetical protein
VAADVKGSDAHISTSAQRAHSTIPYSHVVKEATAIKTIAHIRTELVTNKPGPTTPINPNRLLEHLQHISYDLEKTQYLVNGFTYGFRIQHQGIVSGPTPVNDPSISQHFEIALQKINKELSAGRMKGPYSSPPFKHFRISPIKLVEKSTPGSYRLIHNLSWPYDDTSINANIPDPSKTVKYANINTAIQLIMQFPKPSVTRKTDIAHAFKIIPIHPSDHHKLGMKLGEDYYYDVTLPQGCSSACQIFEEFSTALQAIYDFNAQTGLSTHYLDDFFFVDPSPSISASNELLFDTICTDIGVPQAPDKKTTASFLTEFLGLLLDSENWRVSLPQSKLTLYTDNALTLTRSKKVTQKQLQSIIGKLSFATSAVPARPFLRRLIDKIYSVRQPHHFIKITRSMLSDLETWLYFLRNHNGVTYFRSLQILPGDHFHMTADASKQGYGATFGPHWVQEAFPTYWQELLTNKKIGITTLELYPVHVMIGTFGHRIKNSSVLFHSDNTGVVKIINKQSSPNKTIMSIVRPMVLHLMTHNIQLRSIHIPGKENTICDMISRFNITPSILQEHGMDAVPTQIPRQLQSKHFVTK